MRTSLRAFALLSLFLAAVLHAGDYRLVGFPPVVDGTQRDHEFGLKCASAFYQRAKVSKAFDTIFLEVSRALSDSLKRCRDSLPCYGELAYTRTPSVALFTRLERKGKLLRVHFSWLDMKTGKFRGAGSLSGANLTDLELRLPVVVESVVAKGAGIWQHLLHAPAAGAEFPTWTSIPSGTVTKNVMFSTADTSTKERRFQISGFKSMTTEVSWAQYQACVQAGSCIQAQYSDGTCSKVWDDGSWFPGRLPEPAAGSILPVVCVDWIQARDYCAWVGGTLPTQMQWEHMARAGETGSKPWKNPEESCLKENLRDLDYIKNRPGFEAAFECTDGNEGLSPVGRFPVNGFGVHDLIGNAREWVRDDFGPLLLSVADSLDPTCDRNQGNALKMTVGSSFSSPRPSDIRFEAREAGWPGSATESIGFRCVQPLTRQPDARPAP